jgi:hypothetical protein
LNDDTIGAYPDILTITAPTAATLPGITCCPTATALLRGPNAA